MTDKTRASEVVQHPEVNEVYVDTLVTMLVENGNLHLTLATSRADPGPNPTQQRHVTSRVVMPLATASMVQAHLAQLLDHLRAHATEQPTREERFDGAPRKRGLRAGDKLN